MAQVTEEELAYLREQAAKLAAIQAKRREALKRYIERNPDMLHEKGVRRYANIKNNSELFEEHRQKQRVFMAKKRLETAGYLTKQTDPTIAHALGLVFDPETQKWYKQLGSAPSNS